SSGSELARIACMAVFRHLRFIFGNLPSDSSAVETTTKLATAVSTCVVRLELSGLSACLAAIVCSSLQPPLRPLGHAAGDGASFIIKSVLDRATELLTDQHVASTYSMQNRALWQASFDAFFGLLTEYCMSKFDSVIHALQTQPAVAAVISREMPVELLRASLPHTNEYQRKQLLSFSQRTVPVNNHSSHGSNNGPMTSESIPSSESRKI
ncbi:Os02g0295700, partial [Oryza sativa Japonica Group]